MPSLLDFYPYAKTLGEEDILCPDPNPPVLNFTLQESVQDTLLPEDQSPTYLF